MVQWQRKMRPAGWVCRVEQFFYLHQAPEEERIALASFHLEGNA